MRKLIDKLEDFYKELDKQKIIAIYSVIVLVGVSVVVFFLAMPIFSSQQQLQSKLQEIKKQVDDLNIKTYENKIMGLKQQKLQQATLLQERRDSFVTDFSAFKNLSFTKYSQKNLTDFLDLVMKSSLKHSLIIASVENTKPEKQMLFKNKIKITGSGEYIDILNYIDGLMRYKALKELEKFEIYFGDSYKVEFYLLINFGGE